MASTMRFDRWEDTLGNLVADQTIARGIASATSGGTNNRTYWVNPTTYTTSTSAWTDVTGASIVFNAIPGRLYKATVSGFTDAGSGGARYGIRFVDASNTSKRYVQDQINTTWNRASFAYSYVFTSTGSTTLKLQFSAVDSTTYTIYGLNTDPGGAWQYFIEDIGPA